MSTVINILSPHVADLIAAGEVVERPASAVKELVENAIDAGARNVTVEIKNGGMSYLRVTDDGCGMSPEDAGVAFLRHATSKLRDERGLEAITTLGFRGEALAAISAVSRIELRTREKGAREGTRVTLTAGDIDEMGPVGAPEGTTMIVRDLFYNTPARKKFLKSDRAEASACIQAALRCALGHPEVSVRMLRDGEEVFFSPGDGQEKSAVYALLGRDNALGLLECAGENDGVSVRGYVSAPHAGRGNRTMQFFFLNGRSFRSATLQAALEQAYKNTLLTGRFPGCVLWLRLSPGKVDVNVHPTKNEVKFTEERKVFEAVYGAVRAALEEQTARATAEIRLSPGTEKTVQSKPRGDFFKQMSAEEYRKSGLAEKAARGGDPSVAARQLPLQGSQSGNPAGGSSVAARQLPLQGSQSGNPAGGSSVASPFLASPSGGGVTDDPPRGRDGEGTWCRWGRPSQSPLNTLSVSRCKQRLPAPPEGEPRAAGRDVPGAPSVGRGLASGGTAARPVGDGVPDVPPTQTRLTLHSEAVPWQTSPLVPRPEIPRENADAVWAGGLPPAEPGGAGPEQDRPGQARGPEVSAPTPIPPVGERLAPPAPTPVPPAPDAALDPDAAPAFRLIGEALDTYILVEAGDSLLLIDKHAAHERLNFDRLLAGLGPQMSQTLLVPLTWSPGAETAELLEQNVPALEEAGFELERFGEDGVVVRAVPAELQGGELAALEEIVEALQKGRPGDPREEILHTVACKAAIKAGSRSDPTELAVLAEAVVSGAVRYCPHGRPVSVRLTKAELDKQFKRIV